MALLKDLGGPLRAHVSGESFVPPPSLPWGLRKLGRSHTTPQAGGFEQHLLLTVPEAGSQIGVEHGHVLVGASS